MLIKVTQEDIDKGRKDSVCRCPTALAIDRVLVNKFAAVVGGNLEDGIVIFNKAVGHYVTRYKTMRCSTEVADFVSAFDRGDPVQPLI